MLPFLFVLLLVSCISGRIVQQVFMPRLRKLHAATWDQLGWVKPVYVVSLISY